ncbi:PREDICTED: kinesin-like protein KIF20B isoform X1 [Branchiostoma belcheri]|uniref:Kinesin-like protein KIF20B isoform X1 n=1 Tax=Branchiostoma belcheri TaxID=7741 RepID=A0A6P4YEX0_BRABE|nr:PREDICTED: kinesin-like protein KIF20B isoform X1 [Branchiostoma belcheri]
MSDQDTQDIPLSDGEEDMLEDPGLEDTVSDEIIRKDLLSDFATPAKVQTGRSSIDHGTEHMKVYLRIRPLAEDEKEHGEEQGCMHIDNENTLVTMAPKDSFMYKSSTRGFGDIMHKFSFSRIFNEGTCQKDFFDNSMLGMVKDFVGGQNCLVFTYGVTNSGKTYTIQGSSKDGGILPRTLDVVFNSIAEKKWEGGMSLKPRCFSDVVKLDERGVRQQEAIKAAVLKMAEKQEPLEGASGADLTNVSKMSAMTEDSLCSQSSQKSDTMEDADGIDVLAEVESRVADETSVSVDAQGPVKFSIWVSFAEIYNEYIYDLLEAYPQGKNKRRPTLKLSEDKHGSIYIKGLREIMVTSADEAYKILTIGQKNLHIAATKMNHCSSRSHCIFSIKILRVVDVDDPHVARMSMLSFCDLAGSERYTKTQSTGDRLREAGNINTSILTLGKCIKNLRWNQHHRDNPKIIPFRESKLTRLFQSFFLGHGKAGMIVNVNKCASMFDETYHVLKFSAVAKQIVTRISKVDRWNTSFPRPAPPRNVSLALNNSATPKSRSTVGWASNAVRPSTMVEQDVIEEEEEEEDDDDDAETTYTDLASLVEKLQQELIEERKEKVLMEVRIREEVCEEMAKSLVEIENDYSERLQQQQQNIEEKWEKRIEMYSQSIKKSRKRARVDRVQDEEEEWVSSVLLHAEQVKVKERDEQIKDLTIQVTSLSENLKIANDNLDFKRLELQRRDDQHKKEMTQLKAEKSELQQGASNSSVDTHLQTELSEAQKTIKAQEKEIADLQETLKEAGETFFEKNDEIEKLKAAITEDEEKMKSQNTTITDLQQLVEELRTLADQTKATIAEKEEKIADLAKQIQDQKDMMDQKIEALQQDLSLLSSERNEAINKADKQQNEIQELVEKIQSQTLLLNATSTADDGEIQLLRQKLSELEDSLKEARTKADSYQEQAEELVKSKEELESSKQKVFELEERLIAAQTASESSQVKADELSSKQEEVLSLRKKVEELEGSLKEATSSADSNKEKVAKQDEDLHSLKQKILELEQAAKDSTAETDQYKEKADKYEKTMEDYKTALSDHESFVENLNKEVKELKSELEEEVKTHQAAKTKVLELEHKVEELDTANKTIVGSTRKGDKEKQRLEKALKEANTSHLETKKQNLELEKKLQEAEKQLGEAKKREHLAKKDVKSARENLKTAEEQVAANEKSIKDLDNHVAELKESEGSLKKLLASSQEQADKLTSLMTERESAIKELREDVASKEAAVREKEGEVGSLTQKLDEMQKLHQQDENTCSSHQEEITQLQNQLSEVNKQLKEREASENEMKGQVAKLWNQTQADKTALHDAESTSRQLETQVEGLKGQLKEKEDRAAMLEKDLEIVRSTVSDYKAVREDLEKTRSREVDMRATLQSMTAQQEERNSTIDRLEDSLNTLKQELKEKVDQAKLAQEEQQAAKKEKEDASKKVEELEALLEAKEKRLKTKSATIKELMEKADQERRKAEDERQKYEIAFTDVQGNETVISTLKQALEEQEATMATQDKVLESKQEEIQTFADELEDLQKKYSELLESSDVNKRELKRTISNLEHLKLNYEQADTDRKSAQEELGSVKEEKDGLQEQLKTLSERVQELERTLHSTKGEEGALQNEKDRLEVALVDSKKEVETLEQWLSETKQELEQLKKELEDGEKDNTDKEALEDTVRQLQQDLETVQQQKEEELSQWRGERDQLVSELEKQLKALVAREKATQASLADAEEEIKTLKAEKEETQESGDRLTALQSQLDECYSTISHLEEQLKQQTSGPATRRGRRTTRSAMISEDQLRRELDTCRKQLQEEYGQYLAEYAQLVEEQRAKEKVSDNLDKAVRAKDKIIDELKKSNQDLQRELWAQSEERSHHPSGSSTGSTSIKQEEEEEEEDIEPAEEATEEGDGPIVFDESEIIDEEGNRKRRFPSVHLEMDVTPVVTKRKTKTTRAAGSRRGRKRKSEELVENEDPKVDTPATRTRSRKKVPKTSIKQEPVSPTPSESHVPETPEDQLPLSSLRGSKRTALSRIGDYVSNSPVAKSAKKIVEAAVGLASPTKSPVAESPPRPAEKKKRRKLYKTDISAPFECPPHQLVSTGINEPAEDAHSIVTRRLRTRTHKK